MALPSTLNGKGRSVTDQFGHIHNVRLMWIKVSAPALMEGLEKVEAKSGPDRIKHRSSLVASGEVIGRMIGEAAASGGRIKNFKPHVTAFLGYLISHESHHRGQIGWTLKHSGHPLDKKAALGLWEWGVR